MSGEKGSHAGQPGGWALRVGGQWAAPPVLGTTVGTGRPSAREGLGVGNELRGNRQGEEKAMELEAGLERVAHEAFQGR